MDSHGFICFRNMIGINIGTCLPKSCDEGMIEALLNRITKRILRNKVIFSVVPNTCQVKEDLEWNLNKYDLICLYATFNCPFLKKSSPKCPLNYFFLFVFKIIFAVYRIFNGCINNI